MTLPAKREWEASKTAEEEEEEEEEEVEQRPATSQSVPASDDSQPPHPPGRQQRRHLNAPVRRRFEDVRDGDEDQQPPSKRARYETASPSLEPVPSITSSASLETANEELLLAGQVPVQHLAVELKQNTILDPSEYLSVRESQSTVQSSQPLSELESQDRRITISSLLDQSTIPDSQEEPSNNTESQQSHYAHLRTQHNTVLDSAVEVPDSQDRWSANNSTYTSRTSYPSGTTASGSQRISQSSAYVEQSIPSHQADHPGPEDTRVDRSHNSTSAWGAEPVSAPRNSGHSLSRILEASTEATLQEPVFFTQPGSEASLLISQENSSYPTQHPSRVNPVEESSASHGTVEEDLRASQAAQVLHSPYRGTQEASASGQLVSSNPNTALKSAEAELVTSKNKETDASVDIPESPTAVGNEQPRTRTSLPQSVPPSEATRDVPMSETDGGKRGSSPSRDEPPRFSSAEEQLENLWNEPLGESHALGGAEGFSSAAAQLAALDAANSHEDSRRPSTADYYTQPVQAPSWTSNSALSDQTVSAGVLEAESKDDQPQRSAVDELQDLISQDYRPADDAPSSLMQPPTHQLQPATVSPADVSQLPEPDKVLTLLPSLTDHEATSSGLYDISEPPVAMGQAPLTGEQHTSSEDEEVTLTDYNVTLPFHARARSLYFETLMEYRTEITEYSTHFISGNENDTPPEEQLIDKIDELFGRLQNLCDYPEDILSPPIEEMSPEHKVKFAHGANPKFHFIFEVLQGIRTGMSVLIVARSANLLRPLCELVDVLGLACFCDELQHMPKEARKNSSVQVTIALPDTSDPFLFDLVIGYDPEFNRSKMSSDLKKGNASKMKPVVLRLVTAYSLEHIDLEIEDTRDLLKRKDQLLYAMVKGRHLINDPIHTQEPNEIAGAFIDYLNNDAHNVLWQPIGLPADIFEWYDPESESPSHMSPVNPDNGRKRKMVCGVFAQSIPRRHSNSR